MHWNHRTVEHRNSSDDTHETYTTVHEVYYDGRNTKKFWSPKESSPKTKEQAAQIMAAFDKPPALWVDDSTVDMDGFGNLDYKDWGWL